MDNKTELNRYLKIFLGAVLFCGGINLFIEPVHLYNGGLVGIAQITNTLLNEGGVLDSNMTGILNFFFNIPLLLLAYKGVGKKFFYRTSFSVIAQTVLFQIIPIPAVATITDPLGACLIGGIVAGAGVGITLQAGGAGGGVDVLGVWLSMKIKGFSVGKLSLIVNVFVYAASAVLFELPVAIYSIIYSTFYSLVIDKTHAQNINISAMIITNKLETKDAIIKDLNRGVTYWNAYGAYTNEGNYILMTVISKYEIPMLKKCVHQVDKNAFIISNEGLRVEGNFEKRL